MTGPSVTIVSASGPRRKRLLLQVLQQFMHACTASRSRGRNRARRRRSGLGWPSWAACEQAFDVLRRWG
jgi:hypothetical protein